MQRVIKSPARREGEQEEECFPVLFVVLQDAFAEVGIVNSVHQVEQIRGLSQATFVDIYGDSKKLKFDKFDKVSMDEVLKNHLQSTIPNKTFNRSQKGPH